MASAGAQLLVEVALPVPLDQTFTYTWTAAAEGDAAPGTGDLVAVPFGRRKSVIGLVTAVEAAVEAEGDPPAIRLKPVTRVLPPEYRIVGARRRLAGWLAEYYALPLGEVVPLFHPPSPGTAARRSRTVSEAYPSVDPSDIELTPDQVEAVTRGRAVMDSGRHGTLLLHGVTGSGKTEVYLSLIAAALEAGRSAVFLLPEIALTPQTLGRIAARFGDDVAALHSGLSAGQRCRVHERAARGEVRVVVGPRSALFAPLPDPAVIVVDEEHETSYKQDEKPRYHARHAALVLGREHRALVVLGSATPDLESVDNADRGRFDRVVLPDRLGGSLPEVEIVDLRGAPPADGFSPRLLEALEETLAAGEQAILYYNRRGYARVVQCAGCGEVGACPNCDIGLTYHLRPRRLLCHYCNHTEPVPTSCPECGGSEFVPSGGGTEKIELSLAGRFPEARLLRLDRDTTNRRDSHRRILGAFARGEADILVGTQMVAKGHHFPAVTLVGVLAADDGLGLPDFRASERAFQLLTQVAGRAGRAGGGRVIFQTWQPDHPVLLAAAAHDCASFVADELPLRRTLGYPPHRRLLRIGVQGRQQGSTAEAASRLAKVLRENLPAADTSVLGPAPAVFPRLQDRFRFQILIKGRLTLVQKAWLAGCLREFKAGFRGIDAMHDVDPVSIY